MSDTYQKIAIPQKGEVPNDIDIELETVIETAPVFREIEVGEAPSAEDPEITEEIAVEIENSDFPHSV